MVLAFVRAEFHSREFGELTRAGLNNDLSCIDDRARTDDADQNRARKRALAYVRGYPNTALFNGFPGGIEWTRSALSLEEVGELRCLGYQSWVVLTRSESRPVRDAAANLDTVGDGESDEIRRIRNDVLAIEQELARGTTHPELIVVAESPEATRVLVEGHKRATAYVRRRSPDEVEVLAGYSPRIAEWVFY